MMTGPEDLGGMLNPADDPIVARLIDEAARLADTEARRIGHDTTNVDGTEYTISTVDLITVHPGGHYETLVSSNASSRTLVRRYTTRDLAQVGHQEIVVALNAGLMEDYFGAPTTS